MQVYRIIAKKHLKPWSKDKYGDTYPTLTSIQDLNIKNIKG